MTNKKGTVFNIQHFSVNDGPGIRTTVFLKGCPLQCLWCHNPESKRKAPELYYDAEKCVCCRQCKNTCKNGCHSFDGNVHHFDRYLCDSCGKCTETCIGRALEMVGYEISAKDVIKEVLKDIAFYDNSGGGLTLSGGEPFYQFEFAFEILKSAKENGLHTCVETCGVASEEQLTQIAPLVDAFLFDYKETNPVLHKKFTGLSNELILQNLRYIDRLDKNIVLRCPIIPGYNDTEEHFDGIVRVANSLNNITEIHILPYHSLGKNKAKKLGIDYKGPKDIFADAAIITAWIERIAKKTTVPVSEA